MRSLFTGLGLAAAMVLSPLAHANNVAVADSQAAVLASNVAKQTIEGLNTSLKSQRDRLEQLRKEITGFQERFQKDGSVMSDKDKQALQTQAQSKLNEYNSTAEGVQRRIEEAQSNMLKTLMPKLEGIIEDLRKEGNYDVIVEKKYVIWAAPTADLTKKITDRLNAAK
ncbi:OmpH family outer membrane protein [Aquirhabdus parva]|uniref:OmpH family outer membrane protein n=1 Tax=Aquirhabdus parva TaxID=2283318 RepID=A0A345P6M7_9GAMM|nr:OmpH family outer membrane protein [Aquirhabdus parva]AXI02936.1 OmpH family outer membrane protein [Aquirhabdus parva]